MGSPASHGCLNRCTGGSFAVESAAAFAWNRWQACYGISGSVRVERVAALSWNRWQDSPGIGGSFAVEYACYRIGHRRACGSHPSFGVFSPRCRPPRILCLSAISRTAIGRASVHVSGWHLPLWEPQSRRLHRRRSPQYADTAGRPNQGLELTASSLRSSVAPASGSR